MYIVDRWPLLAMSSSESRNCEDAFRQIVFFTLPVYSKKCFLFFSNCVTLLSNSLDFILAVKFVYLLSGISSMGLVYRCWRWVHPNHETVKTNADFTRRPSLTNRQLSAELEILLSRRFAVHQSQRWSFTGRNASNSTPKIVLVVEKNSLQLHQQPTKNKVSLNPQQSLYLRTPKVPKSLVRHAAQVSCCTLHKSLLPNGCPYPSEFVNSSRSIS